MMLYFNPYLLKRQRDRVVIIEFLKLGIHGSTVVHFGEKGYDITKMRAVLSPIIIVVLAACGGNRDFCETDRDCRDGLVCLDGDCRISVGIDDTSSSGKEGRKGTGGSTESAGGEGDGDNVAAETTPPSGCETDYDCKGDLICEDGRCVYPSSTNIDAGMDAGNDAIAAGTGAASGVTETGGVGGNGNGGDKDDAADTGYTDARTDATERDGSIDSGKPDAEEDDADTDGSTDSGKADAEADDADTDGSADSAVVTLLEPVIPAITGECPSFVSGDFSFQGLTGIMEVGAKGGGEGVIVFHWHGTAMAASNYTMLGLNNITRITSEGGIIVSPDGPVSGESGDVLCSGTAIFGGTTTFDVIDQIVACAVRDHAIDPHKIYATGCSAGGLQSGCMAARRSSYVAAVATNSGGLVAPMGYQDPTRIPSVITMHGAPGIDVIALNFAETSAVLDTQTKNAGGFAVDCDHGGMHCGAPEELYSSAVDFLFDHPFGVDPEPYASGLPPSYPSYCEIF